jgi:hypothetical protein
VMPRHRDVRVVIHCVDIRDAVRTKIRNCVVSLRRRRHGLVYDRRDGLMGCANCFYQANRVSKTFSLRTWFREGGFG